MVEKRPEQSPRRMIDLQVPEIRQRHITWCGLASVSMVLQYWGYNKTPKDLYSDFYGIYNEEDERADPVLKPTFESFAVRVRDHLVPQPPLAPLTARVFNYATFQKLQEKGHTEHDVLQNFIIEREIPCIIRFPEHTVVASGVDLAAKKYLINNPSNTPVKQWKLFEEIDEFWSATERTPGATYEPRYSGDTRYLMLAIYPKKE